MEARRRRGNRKEQAGHSCRSEHGIDLAQGGEQRGQDPVRRESCPGAAWRSIPGAASAEASLGSMARSTTPDLPRPSVARSTWGNGAELDTTWQIGIAECAWVASDTEASTRTASPTGREPEIIAESRLFRCASEARYNSASIPSTHTSDASGCHCASNAHQVTSRAGATFGACRKWISTPVQGGIMHTHDFTQAHQPDASMLYVQACISNETSLSLYLLRLTLAVSILSCLGPRGVFLQKMSRG